MTKPKKIQLAEVVRHGDKMVLPEKMSYDNAIVVLERQRDSEEQEINLNIPVDAFPWDGALCAVKAMKEIFGFCSTKTIKSFFGDNPPQMISVATGVKTKVMVPWGAFELPNIEGTIYFGSMVQEGRRVFQIRAEIKRKYEHLIQQLADRTAELVTTESIYRFKGLRIKFTDDDYSNSELSMPEVKFLDLNGIDKQAIIFSKPLEASVETNVYTPIERTKECDANGIPTKRGILLAGPYGTGKTLIATKTAYKCEQNNWTFIYCEKTADLPYAVKFARQYAPCAIFCEDIDRTVQSERTEEVDKILNIIDGIESKNDKIMIILTTNHVEGISKALLRPGRLDAVINVTPPDAEAVQRLLQYYSSGLIADEEDLTKVGAILGGQIPAVIRECMERSKLSAIRTSDGGELQVTSDNLIESAQTMQAQIELLKESEPQLSDEELVGKSLKRLLTNDTDLSDIEGTLEDIQTDVRDICENTC